MRRITVFLLIILVVGILVGVVILTYSRNEISYVFDHQSTTPTSLVVRRLYSSGINEEEVNRLSQSLLTTSFTEDELLEAALKAGKPEFYPVFTYQVARGSEDNTVIIAGSIEQQLFDGQTSTDFRFTDLRLELTSDTAVINEDSTLILGTNHEGTIVEKAVPILASDGSSLAVQLDTIGAYEIHMEGTTGTIMLQYSYDVVTNRALFDNLVLEDQILQVYVTLNTQEDGTIGATFEVVEASQVSELY